MYKQYNQNRQECAKKGVIHAEETQRVVQSREQSKPDQAQGVFRRVEADANRIFLAHYKSSAHVGNGKNGS